MKRPPGLWLLLSAGVLWLCFQDVSCVRATSLIFGKSSTTSTTTPAGVSTPASSSSADGLPEEDVTEVSLDTANTTKSLLTGIPQQDYLFDPNLPRELNGYNLTSYPFFSTVPDPDLINFPCDGLHDGFYASVEFKCQVYHHCIHGTRYDFLCANYTAFDQRTFICHFVSEVDCVNSKKYWFRNDKLYETPTTTTAKPIIIYAPAPGPHSALSPNRRPSFAGSRRRKPPMRRRRPQYDYYDDVEEDVDDYYEEPRYTATEASRQESRRRKRPRPRPRPVYDDEYEEYEDERYERRGGSRRDEASKKDDDSGGDRKPYKRPSSGRRNKDNDRRKYEDEDEYEDEDARFDRSEERKNKRPDDHRQSTTENVRRPEKRRNNDEEERRYERPKKDNRRPSQEDDYEDEPPKEDRRSNKRNNEESGRSQDEALIKPQSGSSVYDRPRIAPRIRPPVPKTETDKYNFKAATVKPTPKPVDDEEYYDEYEDEAPKRTQSRTKILEEETLKQSPARGKQSEEVAKPALKEDEEEEAVKPERVPPSKAKADSGKATSSNSRQVNKDNRDRIRGNRNPTSTSKTRPASGRGRPAEEDYEYEEDDRPRRKSPKNEERRVGQGSRKRPAVEEYEDDYELPEKRVTNRNGNKEGSKDRKQVEARPRTTSTTTTTTTTTSEAPAREETAKPVRIVKRPFLPSRGGNPYVARGLQPLGAKASVQEPLPEIREKADLQRLETRKNQDGDTRGSHKYIRRPEDPKSEIVISEADGYVKGNVKSIEDPKTRTNRPSKPIKDLKVLDIKNPLDISENEYDVTLNDALNPTLPNLPVRSFPTGFSAANDYTYSAFQRPRYVVDATINQASSEYNYRYKPQPYAQTNYQTGRNDQYGNNGANYQTFRPSPRVTHQQQFFTTY